MAAPFVNFLQAPLQESAFKELGNLVNRYQDSQLRGLSSSKYNRIWRSSVDQPQRKEQRAQLQKR